MERPTLPPRRARPDRGNRGARENMKPQTPFKLRRASFKGRGRQAELREASWDTLRDLTYQDRGA